MFILFSGFFKLYPTDRMKKFKRRLSLTLRGSQTIDESLSELAEQMTIEESSSKDNGKPLKWEDTFPTELHCEKCSLDKFIPASFYFVMTFSCVLGHRRLLLCVLVSWNVLISQMFT